MKCQNLTKRFEDSAFEPKVMLHLHRCCIVCVPVSNSNLGYLGTIKHFFFCFLSTTLPTRPFLKNDNYKIYFSVSVTSPVNCDSPLCVQSFRWLCWVSWLWPPAPAQHLPSWPEDLRLWWGQGADDGCCFCQGNSVPLHERLNFGQLVMSLRSHENMLKLLYSL